ncbi:MAG: hypothetical protein HeimC3_31930 [Candidatus Heimdallarchaeota archaeon LC_3]|nr:MAG: hypothetical protein HeimC3_31930 [Candidatus Heimdallarchaeota archaeon LC_3]
MFGNIELSINDFRTKRSTKIAEKILEPEKKKIDGKEMIISVIAKIIVVKNKDKGDFSLYSKQELYNTCNLEKIAENLFPLEIGGLRDIFRHADQRKKGSYYPWRFTDFGIGFMYGLTFEKSPPFQKFEI